MIIIGHDIIKCDDFSEIKAIEDIKKTPSNSIVIFPYDLKIMDYCHTNQIPFAVKINTLTESIFANNFMARYLIVENNISKEIQNIAENYMFDSKILVVINSDDEIHNIAINGIDGVIYKVFLEGLANK